MYKSKTIAITAIILPLIVLSAYAQVGVASSRGGGGNRGNAIAAYVFGAENAANGEELAEAVVNNLIASPRYSAPRRGAREFFREADKAQSRSRGRLLSDRDFCRIGDDFGVNFLVVIDIERQGRGNSVWARILDLGNCQVIATAEYTGLIRNNNEIRTAARTLSDELIHTRVGRRGGGTAAAYSSHGAPAAPVHRSREREQGSAAATAVAAAPSAPANTFTDPRDGKTYRTVTIGNQVWMAENLNFQTANSWCYNNTSANCDKYGRLYSRIVALSACPAGWRVPNNDDWRALVTAAGGISHVQYEYNSDTAWSVNKLISRTGWTDGANGTDELGFSILPSGFRENNTYVALGQHTGLWSSTTSEPNNYIWVIMSDMDGEIPNGAVGEVYMGYSSFSICETKGFSIRCIRE